MTARRILYSMSRSLFRERSGQAILALTFLIGGIIVLTGVTLAFLVSSVLNATYGYRSAEIAQAAAVAGVEDALMQLDRSGSGFSSGGYPVIVGNYSATVTVVQSSPVAGQVTITSTASVANRRRTIRAIVSENSTTGQIILISWQQT